MNAKQTVQPPNDKLSYGLNWLSYKRENINICQGQLEHKHSFEDYKQDS